MALSYDFYHNMGVGGVPLRSSYFLFLHLRHLIYTREVCATRPDTELFSDIYGSALLSVTVHNQSFLNPCFSAKYGLSWGRV